MRGGGGRKEGEPVSVCEFPTGEKDLAACIKSVEGKVVMLLEECDLAFWARRVLLPYAERVEVADPERNARIHRDSVKKDRVDAKKLSEIAWMGGHHPVWHTPDENVYALHLAVKAYDLLTKEIVAQKIMKFRTLSAFSSQAKYSQPSGSNAPAVDKIIFRFLKSHSPPSWAFVCRNRRTCLFTAEFRKEVKELTPAAV